MYIHVYMHVYRHVYRHVCRHVHMHVYRHVCRHGCTAAAVVYKAIEVEVTEPAHIAVCILVLTWETETKMSWVVNNENEAADKTHV